MASVHLGRLLGPVGFARTVAIKRLHPQFAKDPAFVAMFLDEARLCARIRHPNVVPTLDVVSLEDELFLVMEYVHGESLARLQRFARARDEHVPVEIAVGVMSHVLHGLHAAHEAKSERGTPLDIVHRDVSPQNVLVGTDGVARVLDFGIAKASSRLQVTLEGQLKGKLAYMAPEQLDHNDVDRRVDVWAASVVMWELLVGRRLFVGDHPARLMKAVIADRIPPPSEVADGEGRRARRDEVPKALDDLVMRGLSRDPGGRFESAQEMAIALDATGLVATQHAIGAWVASVATESLATRGDRLADIEGTAQTSPNVLGTTSEPSPDVRASYATLPGDGTFAATERDAREARPRRRVIVAAVGGALVVAAAALAAISRREAPAVAVEAATSTPTLASLPPAPPIVSSAPARAPSPGPASAPTPSTSAPGPALPVTAKPKAPKARPPSSKCDPPYKVGKDGVKIPKLECL
ncbi:MAG: protein kinase [Deltaproteobacteria bacterium]|nr:protein kinase [Deltaproteobacteria bacterium]